MFEGLQDYIADNPGEKSSRRGLIDWLEENERYDEARFMRLLYMLTYKEEVGIGDFKKENAPQLLSDAQTLAEQLDFKLESVRPELYRIETRLTKDGLNLRWVRTQQDERFYGLGPMVRQLREQVGHYPINHITIAHQRITREAVFDAFHMGSYATSFTFGPDNILDNWPMQQMPVIYENHSLKRVELTNTFSSHDVDTKLLTGVARFLTRCKAATHVTIAGTDVPHHLLMLNDETMPALETLELTDRVFNDDMLRAAFNRERFPNLKTIVDYHQGRRRVRDLATQVDHITVSTMTVGEYYERFSDTLKEALAKSLNVSVEQLPPGTFGHSLQALCGIVKPAIIEKRRECDGKGPTSLSGLMLRTIAGRSFDDAISRPDLVREAGAAGSALSGKITTVEDGEFNRKGAEFKLSADDVKNIGRAIAKHLPKVVTQLKGVTADQAKTEIGHAAAVTARREAGGIDGGRGRGGGKPARPKQDETAE